jgi:acyl-[acyl-carrier-protein]-phospholipid O-acyltransferase/long-chain-fatty-acid--[acyl-carrier-protein] ligase
MGAVGMTLFAFDLYIASATQAPPTGALADFAEFFRHAQNWRVLADLLMIAICGGVFIVPLYAILQSRTEESERARAIAANNIMNAVLMIAAAVIASAMLWAGLSIPAIFLALAVGNSGVALYSYRIVPRVSAP